MNPRGPSLPLVIMCFFWLLTISTLCLHVEANSQVLSLFQTSHQEAFVPEVGLTLLSEDSSVNLILDNGETEDFSFSFLFVPENGTTVDSYDFQFLCEDETMNIDQSCDTASSEITVSNSDVLAYNSSVTCSLAGFPGTTTCRLTAVPVNEVVEGTVAARQEIRHETIFTSAPLTVTISGIVFFIPDTNGGRSISSTIISGVGRSFKLEQYDRVQQNPREMSVSIYDNKKGELKGSKGLDVFLTGGISIIDDDPILHFDPVGCDFIGAQHIDGQLRFPNASQCALGVAVRDNSSLVSFGVQVRAYKSGNYSFDIQFPSFLSSGEDYIQVIQIEIVETAPPVITAIEKDLMYKSVPCGPQTMKITGYNVHLADGREIVVQNDDGTTTVWTEALSQFLDNRLSDISEMTFISAGGSGTNVPFNLIARFGGDLRTGVTLDQSLDSKLSFSTKPALSTIRPNFARVQGGPAIQLTGNFEGLSSTSFILVGGFMINYKDILSQSTSRLTFFAPPRAQLGLEYKYNVTVNLCAEQSNPAMLVYYAPPLLEIIATSTSQDDENVYLIPDMGSTFVATAMQNSEGLTYQWQVTTSSNEQVNTGSIPKDKQQFLVDPTIFPATSDVYTLSVTGTNTLGLSHTAAISIRPVKPDEEFMTVIIYPPGNLTRSLGYPVLIQASISAMTGTSDSAIVFLWTYLGKEYIVDESVPAARAARVDETMTGPTLLGLEFNIAREDLQIGETALSLNVYEKSNPDRGGTFITTIIVDPSVLKAKINDGVNGTVILTGTDLKLTGEGSRDPDVISEKDEPDSDLKYEWFGCRKSLMSSFNEEVSDCSALISQSNQQTITIKSDALFNRRLDKGTNPKPTYFLFGLKVSKGSRSTITYTYFQLQTSSTNEKVPMLTSLEVVNGKGIVLDKSAVSSYSEIIIRPWTDEGTISWKYDMRREHQKYLLTQKGVLKGGNEFLSDWTATSRLPLRFSAGALEPNQKYTIVVKASAKGTSLVTDNEITFMTLEAPRLICEAPIVSTGNLSETMFTVSARMTFETERIEYCFTIVTSPSQKISVGKGCSSVPFAKFTFDIAGTFDIECMAKTVDGVIMDTMVLPSAITVEPIESNPNATPIQIVSARLDRLETRVQDCKRLRDHACLMTLMSLADEITADVEDVLNESETETEETTALREKAQSYIGNLASIIGELAEAGVVKATQTDSLVQVSFSMCNVPSEFFTYDALVSSLSLLNDLYSYLISSESPVLSDVNAQKTIACVNQTIGAANVLVGEGSSRRRLLRESCDSRLDCLVPQISLFMVLIQQQQSECGTSMKSDGNYPALETRRSRENNTSGPTVVVGSSTVCQQNSEIEAQADKDHKSILKLENPTPDKLTLTTLLIPAQYFQCMGLDLKTNYGLRVITNQEDETSNREYELKMLTEENGLKEKDAEMYELVFKNSGEDETTNTLGNQCPKSEKAETEKVTVSDNSVTFSVKRSGLFVGGRAAANPATMIAGMSGGLLIGLLVSMGIVILIVSIIAVWFIATSCVALPDLPVVTNWEYVERDMFGRGDVPDGVESSNPVGSPNVPDGANPPEESAKGNKL